MTQLHTSFKDAGGSDITEKRRSLRHAFTAAAIVTELGSQARVSGRTADLTRESCYVDAMSSFAAGSTVMVHLTKEKKAFSTLAKVVHAHPGMGMSLLFEATDCEQRRIVDSWLGGPGAREMAPEGQAPGETFPAESIETLKYLILKLVQKQLLSDQEGISLLAKLGVLAS